MMYGYRNAEEMARTLVTYIDDPVRVRDICMANFDTATPLSVWRIKDLRKNHLNQVARMKRGKWAKGVRSETKFSDGRHGSADLAIASRKLLAAIIREHPEHFGGTA